MLVVVLDEGVDLALEVGHGVEGAAANRLVGDEREPAFDLIEPGAVGGREVQGKARVLGQPGTDSGVFVGGVVVADRMHVPERRNPRFDVTQQSQELLVPMLRLAQRDDGGVGISVCEAVEDFSTAAGVACAVRLGTAPPRSAQRLADTT